MGRARGSDLTDSFAGVFGVRRGAAASARTILEAREMVAHDELSRLMDLAVSGDFTEPLLVVRACANALGQRQTSLADVLRMCVATQMTEHYHDRVCLSLAAALGWAHDSFEQESFASGLRSRMHELLEEHLLECPPENWESWLPEKWGELFPLAVTRRLVAVGADRYDCALRLLLDNGDVEYNVPEVVTGLRAAANRLDESDWREVVEQLLGEGPHLRNQPLTDKDIAAARERARIALQQKITSGGAK